MAFSKSFTALIEQTWGGDRKAFETLYRILHKYLATYIGDSDAASDLVQETFIQAWKQWPKLRDIAKVKSWLFTIATHLAIDHLRRKQRSQPTSLEEWGSHEDHSVAKYFSVTNSRELPEEHVEHEEKKRRVRLAIAEVSPEYRDCMILYIVEEVTQQEIATLLRKHVRTVQRHIKLGLEELRQAYLRLDHGQSIDMERKSVR